MPGHFGIFNKINQFETHKYWEIKYSVNNYKDEKWFVKTLDELLNEATKLHLLADVNVGSYLSGGIESSLVTALAFKNSKSKNFEAFNVRFTDFEGFDESIYAKSLASKLNLNLNVVNVSEKDFVENMKKLLALRPTNGCPAYFHNT